jgi:phosphoribosylglycinamide formyltransferase-1
MSKSVKNIAILASGAGSNAQKIVDYFSGRRDISVRLIVSNKQDAGVLNIARAAAIDTLIVTRNSFYSSTDLLAELDKHKIDFIVLAGFLWLIPTYLIQQYPDRIINIHPALLPNYGGKGMYGSRVHEAVVAAGEKETGITIHWVDAHYDEGDIIFQAKCAVDASDTPTTVAEKIHVLEHQHFAPTIEKILLKK